MDLGAGEIYFIKEFDVLNKIETSFVKIGLVREDEERSSVDRAKQHQTSNPRKLLIHHRIKTQLVSSVENKLHRFYAKNRVSGEWFNLTPELLDSAIDKAEEFSVLAEKDFSFFSAASSLTSVSSTEEVLTRSETIDLLYQKLLDSKFKLVECKKLETDYKNLLKQVLKENGNIESFAKTLVKKPKAVFDQAALKREYPEIWELFQVTKDYWSQRFLLVDSKRHFCDLTLSDPSLHEFIEKFKAIFNRVQTQLQPIDDLQDMYFELRVLLSSYEWEGEVAESQLKILIGDAREIQGVCTWIRSFQKKVSFDQENFILKHPDIFEEFSSIGHGAETLIPKKF
jgi:hypothetical protein